MLGHVLLVGARLKASFCWEFFRAFLHSGVGLFSERGLIHRTLLGDPGLTARSKKLRTGAPGIATRSKDATMWLLALLLGARSYEGAPGIATRRKDATRGSWPYATKGSWLNYSEQGRF